MRIFDSHVHFLSHRFLTLLAAQKPGATVESVAAALGWPTPPEDPARLAAQWAAELDRHGVAQAALIASLPGDEISVAEALRAFPHRFAGYFFCNPASPGSAATVRNALGMGLRGVCLFPAMHGYALGDERVEAVLELAAAQPGALAFVHCGMLTVGFRKKLGLPHSFDPRLSDPLDVLHRAQQFPTLPFVIPHFGAGLFREALMLASVCPNVYFDTSSSNRWIECQFPSSGLEEVFARALAVLGPERLLFGTDSSFFPRGWQSSIRDAQWAVMDRLGVSRQDRALIAGGNLRRLLGMAETPASAGG